MTVDNKKLEIKISYDNHHEEFTTRDYYIILKNQKIWSVYSIIIHLFAGSDFSCYVYASGTFFRITVVLFNKFLLKNLLFLNHVKHISLVIYLLTPSPAINLLESWCIYIELSSALSIKPRPLLYITLSSLSGNKLELQFIISYDYTPPLWHKYRRHTMSHRFKISILYHRYPQDKYFYYYRDVHNFNHQHT